MFAPFPTPSFPPADALLSALVSINYKKVANQAITFAATFAAVVVAISLFAYKNAKAFWAAHGETILFHAALFAERLVKTSKVAFAAAVSFKPVAVRAVNRAADWLFYQLAA
jgi:hypothetical protein